MPDLAKFQDAFIAALGTPEALAAYGDRSGVAAGLMVYRNTIYKGTIDALAANYPTVERLVGAEWFTACAGAFYAEHPPGAPMLVDYGEGFADFLRTFLPAEDLPYLPAVASIDRFWTEAHIAADADPLPAGALAGLAPAELATLRPTLHPSVRLAWFHEPAPSIWLLNRPIAEEPSEGLANLAWRPEGVLLARLNGVIECKILDQAAFAFMSCSQDGGTLGDCAIAAVSSDAEADVAGLLAELVQIGAFALADDRPDVAAGDLRA